MKKILKAVLALVVILLVLVLAHPLWIGPVVRSAVSMLAPKYLGVPAHLDGFSLNAYKGRVTFDGFALDNPPGCREPKFVTVGHLCIDLDPLSLTDDAIVVEEISVQDLYVSIMSDEKKVYNFTTVSEACSSAGGNRADKPKPEKKADDATASGPKFIIDLIQVQHALVQWERVPLPLPSFRLTGIGRGAGGVGFEAAWEEIETKFIRALGPLAAGLQTVLSQTNGALGAGLKSAAEVTKSVTDVSESVDTTKKALTDVGNALKDGSSASADAAQKSVDAAVKSVKGSVDSLKSLFK